MPGPKPTCSCGQCRKCKNRENTRAWATLRSRDRSRVVSDGELDMKAKQWLEENRE